MYELPPNPQGIAALQQLNILELHDLAALEHNGADYLHLHVEKLAFADRENSTPTRVAGRRRRSSAG